MQPVHVRAGIRVLHGRSGARVGDPVLCHEEGIRITKGTKSREKHETGRRFRAFRLVLWYSWSEFCPANEVSPLGTQELDGHPNVYLGEREFSHCYTRSG